MSDLIKNMIAQIADKNYKGAQSTFEDVMTSKIGNAFDLEKIKLAGSIFNDIDIVAESVDPEDDEEDLDDEELDEENLSELSQGKIDNYYHAAATDRKKAKSEVEKGLANKKPDSATIKKTGDAYKRFQKRGKGMTVAAGKMAS